jgi:hypothetical protein
MNKRLVAKLIIVALYTSGLLLLACNTSSNVFIGIMLCFLSKDLENSIN